MVSLVCGARKIEWNVISDRLDLPSGWWRISTSSYKSWDSISEISIELARATKLWCPVQATKEDVERFIGKRPHICLAIG